MKRLICTFLLILTILSAGVSVGSVHAATSVGGVISVNTTWTRDNSPYTLTGNLLVNNNISLIIEPGVTVDFGSFYMQVNGTLNARGESGKNIVFVSNTYYERIEFLTASTKWDEQSGTGCIIENAIFNRIYLTINGYPKINANSFNSTGTSSLNVNGGAPILTNNIFNILSTGVVLNGGSPVFSYNSITGSLSQFGIQLGSATTAVVSHNNITNCQVAIYSASNATIQGNLIINNYNGIVSTGLLSVINNNVVAGNNLGILASGSLQSNTIVNNLVGMAVALSATVTNNNIYSNTQSNIVAATANTFDAANNWWGTTDADAINRTILDSKTSTTGTGTVNFVPFLQQPNPTAPSLPNITLSPPPTVTPRPYPYPTPTTKPIPTTQPAPTTPTPTETPDPTLIPLPTPSPTPKIVPGSALVFGNVDFAELLTQFDLWSVAQLVLAALGIMWVIIILVYVSKKYVKDALSS